MLAETGGRCVFLSPWAYHVAESNSTIPKVSCDGVSVVVVPSLGPNSANDTQRQAEKWFQFYTEAGDVCTISQIKGILAPVADCFSVSTICNFW